MKSLRATLKLVVVVGAFLLLVGVTGSVKAQAAENRCLLGPGLSSCTQYAEMIQAAGFDPSDTSKCYIIQSSGVEQRSCTTAPFNIQPGQNLQQALQNDTSGRSWEEQNRGFTCNTQDECLNQNPLTKNLIIIINFLSGAVAIVVVAVIIIAGVQYSAAGGNPNATAAAKKRILNAILALVAYLTLFMFMQWLVPGGFLN